MELFLEAGQNYAFLLELIVHYVKLDGRGKVKIIHLSQGAIAAVKNKELAITVPSLVTSEGHVETEIFLICKSLFEVLPQWKGFFLGEGDESTEISDIKAQLKEGKELRKHLQKHLEGRTFFVGNHITFADFFMFTQLYDNILELTDEQKQQYNNLFRWYKHVQNMPQVQEFMKITNRFIISDPSPKYPFLAEKKKSKKDKKEDKGDKGDKKESKEILKTEATNSVKKEESKVEVEKQTTEEAKKEEGTKLEPQASEASVSKSEGDGAS